MENDFLSSVNLATETLLEDAHHAKWMYERLIDTINKFEETLPDNMQAGGRLVNFKDITFSINDLDYWNPDIIRFYGTLSDGAPVVLVQHTSQLNLLLVAVPRTDTSISRRKIGFDIDSLED